MAREKEGYRDALMLNADRLDAMFPDKLILSRREASEALGIDESTFSRRYGKTPHGIDKGNLAVLITKGA